MIATAARVLGVSPDSVRVLRNHAPVIVLHYESYYEVTEWSATRITAIEAVQRSGVALTVNAACMHRDIGVHVYCDVILRVGTPYDPTATDSVTAWPVGMSLADLRGVDWSTIRCDNVVLYY